MRRVLFLVLGCALFMSGLSTVAGPVLQAVAAEDDGTVLPIPRFVDIEADPVHGREFISGVDSVVVADVAGNVVTTLEGLPRAAGMVITPDYSTLYVALNDGDAIVAIDTVTLARTVYPTGAGSCPKSLALAAGMVWYFSACNFGREGFLEALNPATGAVSRSLTPAVQTEFLVSAPAARPNMLVSSALGTLSRLQVTGGATPTVEVAATREAMGGVQGDITLTTNGNWLLAAGGASRHHDVFNTRTFRTVASYPSNRTPVAVAVRADGTVAAGTDDSDGYSDDVFVYAPGQTVFSAHHNFGTNPGNGTDLPTELAPQGLAFGAERLFAVTVDSRKTSVSLRVLDDAAPATPPVGGHKIRGADFYQIVADPVHRRAFITGGSESNGVLVVNIAGRVVEVLQRMPGATQMVFDRAHSTVYVALTSGSAIAAINTRTLQVRKISTGLGTCPNSVAIADGLLWFTQECYGVNDRIGSLNPRTGKVHLAVGGIGLDGGILYGSVTHPRTLYSHTYYSTVASRARRLRVTGGARPTARVATETLIDRDPQEIVATPDGLHAILASPYVVGHQVVQWADMSLAAVVRSDNMPAAAAVRSDGLVAKGNGEVDVDYVSSPRHVYAVTVARSALGRNIRYIYLPEPSKHTTFMPRGLAFAKKNLFTVNRTNSGYLVAVHAMPALRKLSLTTDKRVYGRGETARTVAHLDPSLPGRNRRVSIFYRPRGSDHRLLLTRRAPNKWGNVTADLRITRPTTISVEATTSRGTWRRHLTRTAS